MITKGSSESPTTLLFLSALLTRMHFVHKARTKERYIILMSSKSKIGQCLRPNGDQLSLLSYDKVFVVGIHHMVKVQLCILMHYQLLSTSAHLATMSICRV